MSSNGETHLPANNRRKQDEQYRPPWQKHIVISKLVPKRVDVPAVTVYISVCLIQRPLLLSTTIPG